MKSSNIDYSVAQKSLHWLMGLAIMLDLFVAQKFGGVMTNVDRFESRSDHASLGTLVVAFLAVRLLFRIHQGTPPLPGDIPGWQQRAAHTMHIALYTLIGVLGVSGITAAANADSVVSPFGLFSYGDGAGSTALFNTARSIHELSTELIIGLIALHIAAAIYHLVSSHRRLTLRMLTFWKSGNSS